jgi:glucose/arabinose dehydrogenase
MTRIRPEIRTLYVAVFSAALSCAFSGAAEIPSDLELEAVGDEFDNPVVATGSGDGSGRIFVAEQTGRIKIVGGGTFLDISGRVDSSGTEQGLLGLAFHPDYSNNGFFYVNYTHDPGPGPDLTRVSRFSVSDGDDGAADPDSEVVVLAIPQDADNHNAGDMHFGPDGYLYIATGDGGGGEDPNDRGQSLATLLGKLLRIDVDGGNPYGIPQSNPFVGVNGALDEIWAYGLRNPWRFSFDRATGDLYIGDVGQYDIEEIDLQPASSSGGENYGWSCMEGDVVRNYNPCDDVPLTAPILVYDHDLGCSVTGGFVYRGKIGGLNGLYVFADYCSGRIWFAEPGAGGWTADEWGSGGFGLSSFGEGDDGELYVANRSTGVISRFFSPSAIATDGFEFGDFSRWSDVKGN